MPILIGNEQPESSTYRAYNFINEITVYYYEYIGGVMKKLLYFLPVIVLILMVKQCSKDGKANQQKNEVEGIPVETMMLHLRPFSEYLQITGTVEARNRINIIAEEAGTLRKIIKDKGNFVRAGDTIAIIENKIITASYDEAKAALNQAQLDFSSKKVLYEKRAISENEYLASKYGLERAQAAYELNKARFSKLYLTAPLNGYVNDRFIDIGSFAMPMSAVFDFIDNAHMKITAGVAERFLSDVQIGTPAKITFDALPDLTIDSKVTFINRSIDPMSRTFQVEIVVPNPNRKLIPQMIANVQLLRRSFEDQIVIPLDAVIESEQGRYAFVATNNNQAKKVPVELLAIYQDSALVTGLTSDQKLIVIGQQEVTDGDQLLIKNEE